MNDRISALVDGELSRDESMATIKSLGASDVARDEWDTYHVIGAALRNEVLDGVSARRARTDAIFAKLASEPTVLAPAAMKKVVAPEKRTRIMLAMAASVATVSAVGLVAWRQQSMSVPAVVVVAPAAVSAPAAADTRVNDYLALHRQFANTSGFQAAALVKPNVVKQAAGNK